MPAYLDANGVEVLGLYDGVCTDGGPDAATDYCALGTDCQDCGFRVDQDEDGVDREDDCDDADGSVGSEGVPENDTSDHGGMGFWMKRKLLLLTLVH